MKPQELRADKILRGPIFPEPIQIITSASWVSHIADAKESLMRSNWDLIIVDEAHKMSAASRNRKTLAYDLGDPATLDWQPIVKVEQYRLRQDSVKHPVELKEDAIPYRTGGSQ